MRVRVKDFPVWYKDRRYQKDDVLIITQEAFNGELFECLDNQTTDKK